jgi:hypothetical protein
MHCGALSVKSGQIVIYMLEINLLVAVVVFGFAGMFIMVLFAWTQVKRYVNSIRVMHASTRSARTSGLPLVTHRGHSATLQN